MRKNLVTTLLVLWSITCFSQNKCYHLLDYTCASCPPSVFMWNVDKSLAVEIGDYVEEYTDSLRRVTKLLSYNNNKNKRAVIDDWDYVIYEYTDSTIVVIELVSPQWWYPIYVNEYGGDFIYGSPTAVRHEIKYDPNSKTHEIISSTFQTIRGWEYYATQLIECNYYSTYEQAYEYVKSHFVYTEEPEFSVRVFRKPHDAYVPFYSYSYYKNGIGQVEPMGVLKRESLMY